MYNDTKGLGILEWKFQTRNYLHLLLGVAPVEPSDHLQEIANKLISTLFPVNMHSKKPCCPHHNGSAHQYIYIAWNLNLDNYRFEKKKETSPGSKFCFANNHFLLDLPFPRRYFAKLFM